MTIGSSTVTDRSVAEDCPAQTTLKTTTPRTVLAYHELSVETTNYNYALSCRQFEDHLQLLAQIQEQSGDDNPPAAVSFDDGHISNYTRALPLLEKYHHKATFFVIAGRIGENKGFMNWDHLRELVSLGHQVESHSWSHRFLTDCSESDLRDELIRSRQTLEDRLGIAVEALSAPHGRWNRRVLRACADAGYRKIYTSDPLPRSRQMEQVAVIGRLVMVQSMYAAHLAQWLSMGRTGTALCRTRYALKRSAQRLLGDKLYYRVWSRLSGWNGADDTSLSGRQ